MSLFIYLNVYFSIIISVECWAIDFNKPYPDVIIGTLTSSMNYKTK